MLKNVLLSLMFSLASIPSGALANPTSVSTQINSSVDYALTFDIHSTDPITIKSKPQPDFTKDVLIPLQAEQKAEAEKKAAEEAAAAKAAEDARIAAEAQAAADAQAALLAQQQAAQARSYVSYGNTYDWGNCTWYVASRRQVPSNWGNARNWYAGAQSAGYATGSYPRAGAIGVSFNGWAGHVVYVESVNGDGSVNVSEMNVQGLGVKDYATYSASNFVYIY